MVLLAIDLHLVRLRMISIMPPARHQGPWYHHHGRPSPLQYISWIYIRHAGLKKGKTTTIWLLPVVYNKSHFIQQFCNNDHITSHALQKQVRRF